jgi:hypothetical protein
VKVQVLELKPGGGARTFDILVAVGEDKYVFSATVDDDDIPVVQSEDNYWRVFQTNPMIAKEIHKLVYALYRGQSVTLPVDVGELKGVHVLTE